jgi:hypothetical protein
MMEQVENTSVCPVQIPIEAGNRALFYMFSLESPQSDEADDGLR